MNQLKAKNNYEYEEGRIIRIQVLSRVFGIAISIFFLAISFFNDLADDKNKILTQGQTIVLIAAGLLMGIAVERAGDIWSNFLEHKRQKKENDRLVAEMSEVASRVQGDVVRLKSVIQESYNVQNIGSSPDKILQHISDMAESASKIRNTFVNIYDSDEISEGTINIYNKFLARGGRWYDIVSINEFFSDRYSNILPDDYSQTGGSLINRKMIYHEIVVLKHSLPIVNFAIFDFPDGRESEVLFGWAGGRQHGRSSVFKSSESQIVSMFEKIFLSMWDNKRMSHIVVDYSLPKNDRLKTKTSLVVVDKIGVWYTHGYVRKENGSFEHKTTALFKIEFIGGKPTIEGIVANAESNGNFQIIDHRNQDLVQHSESKIFIEFASRREMTPTEGFVLYKFKTMSSKDIISGFAIDNYYDNKLHIVGERISNIDIIINDKMLIETRNSNAESVDSIWKKEMGIFG